MKLANLVGERFKERPADCVIDSHALMLRGGYMKGMANGIFSLFPAGKTVTRKIENIIREEMNLIDGQECMFPVVMPATIWRESGRYDSIGSEMLRFTDRAGADMLLGMTHEEAAVHLVRTYGQTYTKYPFMIYQIQTKFRDEPRARAGLIRVREFTMKDGYSFHTSQADLEAYYARAHKAYERIFARAGIPEVISVMSDSGMMGGKVAHEFMLLTAAGEDTIAVCSECGYSSNLEVAECVKEPVASTVSQPLELKNTPNMCSIEEVATYLNVPVEGTCKAVIYQKNADDGFVCVFLRGDREANDIKVAHTLGEEVHPAEITADCGLCAGFIGPMGLPENCTLIFDRSLEGEKSLVCGANKTDYHYAGFELERDYGKVEYVDVSKIKDGGVCPQCKKHAIKLSRGIEVGNIFQLGTKYTKSMNMTYMDADGNEQYPIMGCYGIGVGRLAASVCEVRHDDYGPVWPITIAPWQVHICCLRSDDEKVRGVSDAIYNELLSQGVEVIYDDRAVRPGVMFSDADLLGVPVRILVSVKNCDEGVVELMTRDKKVNVKVKIEDAVSETHKLIEHLFAEINEKV